MLLLLFSFLFGRRKRKIAQNRKSNDDKQETDAVGETRRKTRSQIYHLGRDSGSQVVLEDIEMDFLPQPLLQSSSSSSCNSEPLEEPTVKSTSIQFKASHVKLDLDVMETGLPSHLTAPLGYMHHPVSLRRSQSLGELTTTHKSARLLSSDQSLRRVKSSPYNLGGNIFMKDYAQETLSREAKVSFVGLDLAETGHEIPSDTHLLSEQSEILQNTPPVLPPVLQSGSTHLTAAQGYMDHPISTRRIHSLSEPTTTHKSARLLSSDQLLRQAKSSPYILDGDVMKDYSQETLSEEAKVSFVGLDLAETASQGYMDHPVSTRRIHSLSEPTTTHKSARLLSSDQLLRQVKSSPYSLDGDIMKDDAEETLSEEAKDIECQSNKEMSRGSKVYTATFSAPTTEHLESAPSSSFSVDPSTSPSNEDVLTSTHSKFFKSEESDSSADNSSKASFNEDADRSRFRRSFPFLFFVVLAFLLYLMIF